MPGPVSGIRASHRTQLHYERQQPGALVHIDVKKLGRIPDNGRWRPDGTDTIDHNRSQTQSAKLGMNYIHITVEDQTRIAPPPVPPHKKSPTPTPSLPPTTQL